MDWSRLRLVALFFLGGMLGIYLLPATAEEPSARTKSPDAPLGKSADAPVSTAQPPVPRQTGETPICKLEDGCLLPDGVVTGVRVVEGTTYVQVSIGSDDGLKVGRPLEVYRGATYLGQISITLTEPDKAVGRLLPPAQGPLRIRDRVHSRLGLGSSADAEPLWPPVHGGAGLAEAKVRRKLDEPTRLEVNEIRLQEAVEYLNALHDVNVVLDKFPLETINITGENLVTLNVHDVSLRSALRLMLNSIDPKLAYTIRDEVLLITTQELAAGGMVERVYDVSALLNQGESAEALASALAKTFHDGGIETARTAKPDPAEAPRGAAPAPKPVRDAGNTPRISARGSALLVRGAESEHEALLRLLRGLKQQADAAKPAAVHELKK